jgi:predicted nucleic acid-binding protein
MTLVDAGPLVALIDRKDRDHLACRAVLSRLAPPMITTWPAFTEAMYLGGQRGGWTTQERLWRIVIRRDLVIQILEESHLRRARDLMEKYQDVPMDLADATLVALAETLGERRIFTLDADFTVYRLHGRTPFTIVP